MDISPNSFLDEDMRCKSGIVTPQVISWTFLPLCLLSSPVDILSFLKQAHLFCSHGFIYDYGRFALFHFIKLWRRTMPSIFVLRFTFSEHRAFTVLIYVVPGYIQLVVLLGLCCTVWCTQILPLQQDCNILEGNYKIPHVEHTKIQSSKNSINSSLFRVFFLNY